MAMPPHPLADLGAGLSTRSAETAHPAGPKQHGPIGQTERAFTAASTFLSGVMAISATQFLGAPLKAMDPKMYDAWMSFTKQSFGVLITTMTQWWAPTVVRVSGDTSIPKQLFRKPDGSLECRFPKRIVMMANHQLYTDWLYLWWVAYTNNMHGSIYIILKESLKNVPIIGWGAQFYNFIFLKRKWEEDRESFQQHLQQLNNPADPMWLLIFPEGTNLAKGTKEKSAEWAKKRGLQDMKHQLLPRSKGLQFCLQNLKGTTEWLYDCTIGYEGIPPGEFGQDIFTLRSSMFEGRPPKSVNMHFRRFKVADIPLENDAAFDVWLRNRWREKDYLLEHFAQYNSFPEDEKWLLKQQQLGRKGPVPAKSIETQIKSNSLEEFLSIFAPLSSIMVVLSLFYGGGKPEDMMKMLGDVAKQHDGLALVRDDKSETQPLKIKQIPKKTPPAAKAKTVSTAIPPTQRQQHQNGQPGVKAGGQGKQSIPKRASSVQPLRRITSETNHLKVQRAGSTVMPSPTPALKRSPGKAVPQPTSTSKAAPAAQGSTPAPAKASAARPKPARALSSVSTIRPDDSISAANGPTLTGIAATSKPPIATPRTVKPAAGQGSKPPSVAKKAAATGQPSSNKPVNVDSAMLMRMKKAKNDTGSKSIKINPAVLARMQQKPVSS